MTSGFAMRPAVVKGVLIAAVVFLSAMAMWPSAGGAFVLDDPAYIASNPLIRDLSPKGVRKIFASTHYGLYKPVTMLSFALDYRNAGLRPRVYHITNIVLHSANAALVLLLVLLLTGDSRVAFLCALLFGVHPLHVESVAWISERKDMLYSLFFLLSSLFYIKYVTEGSAAGHILSLVCFGLSLMAKPMGLTLPAVLFVYDYLLGRRFAWRLALEKVFYILLAGLFGLWTYALLHSANQLAKGFSLPDRVLFVFYGLKFYVWKLICPVTLSAMYPFPDKPGGILPLEYWLSPVTVLGCIALLFLFFRRSRAVMAGLAFYMITVAPVLQFVPVGPVITADRYSYIPALGLFLPLSVYAVRLLAKLREKNIRLAAGVTVCMALCVITLFFAARARCAAWKNNMTLFSDAVEKYPSFATLRRFALELHHKQSADALAVFNMALKLAGPVRPGTPRYFEVLDVYIGIGRELYFRKDAATAEKIFRQVYFYAPGYPPALTEIACIEADKGNMALALQLLAHASREPVMKAESFAKMGAIFETQGKYRSAGKFYARALELDPSLEDARIRLAVLLKKTVSGAEERAAGHDMPGSSTAANHRIGG
ncbi:MAG: hypothetical protein PHW69_02290 [Elusimicrobiaceae bacterium]|nr:hypothetical protein [Elusimicrobiaceae bacterium]